MILVVYAFNSIELHAQSFYDDMYSKEWEEERDLYCKDSYSAGLANSAKKSLMSMSNSDISTIVRPDGKGGVVNAGFKKPNANNVVVTNSKNGIRFINGNSAQSTVRNSQINKIKSNTSARTTPSFMEYRRQQMKIAAQKAHERMVMEKLRKKREDDRSEMIAKQNYYQRTEQEFRIAVERDHWHATEGAKAVDESLKPSDYFTIPQKDEKKNDGGLIIITEFSLQKNIPLNEKSSQISVTDLTDIRPDVIDDWISALEKEALVDIKSPEGAGKSLHKKPYPVLLISHDELLLDSTDIFVIPGCGPVMILEDSMLVLKDYQLRKVAWKDNLRHTYVIPCGNYLISRIDNKIYSIYDGTSKCLLELDTNNISIFSNSENSFFFVAFYNEISAIYKVDIVNRKYDEICRIPFYVWKLEANNDDIYILLNNKILTIGDGNTKPCVLYNVTDGLNDMILSPWGMLVATDSNILRLNSKGEQTVFYENGAKQIWVDGNEVYFLSLEGDLLYFEDGNDCLTN
ncbi:MAG: hypothetical protein BHV77_12290 [Bacteroides sp. 43_108]|nr:MAG: hypothetical protein BHV77_12290 [Bacteroides sp. 43_108]